LTPFAARLCGNRRRPKVRCVPWYAKKFTTHWLIYRFSSEKPKVKELLRTVSWQVLSFCQMR